MTVEKELVAISHLIKEVGEALESVAETLADGVVEENELKATIPKLEGVIQECASLKYVLEDLCKKRKKNDHEHAENPLNLSRRGLMGSQSGSRAKRRTSAQTFASQEAAGRPTPPRRLERLGEPGLKEFTQLGGRLELWDGVKFLERRRECVRQTPDRPRTELLVPRIEVEVVNRTGQMLRSLKFALDERLVDDDLGGDIRQFTPLPRLDLLSHGLEIPRHPVHADRDAIDERERLRVFCEH